MEEKKKICIYCNNTYDISFFTVNKVLPDGHTNSCKSCRKKYNSIDNKIHRKEKREKLKDWRKNNPEKNILYNKRHKIWLNNHKEEQLLKAREYYYKNKEQQHDSHMKYKKTENYKDSYHKSHARRYRNLKWIKIMENPFPKEIPIHWHHINSFFVIPIPKDIHSKNLGIYHKEKIEKYINKLFVLDLKEIGII
jgi:hypothetical protein